MRKADVNMLINSISASTNVLVFLKSSFMPSIADSVSPSLAIDLP